MNKHHVLVIAWAVVMLAGAIVRASPRMSAGKEILGYLPGALQSNP